MILAFTNKAIEIMLSTVLLICSAFTHPEQLQEDNIIVERIPINNSKK